MFIQLSTYIAFRWNFRFALEFHCQTENLQTRSLVGGFYFLVHEQQYQRLPITNIRERSVLLEMSAGCEGATADGKSDFVQFILVAIFQCESIKAGLRGPQSIFLYGKVERLSV